ncbi:hypothetical protein B0G76_6707 [Paraburkholderia sp. BL23I1N1]|uniref:hypothetical protein n=1 Tax=Paraburkholderia sp. BL23I1N1 TaxID=1938802 RepID=UPI000E770B3B|nr:hypothetical protein [Paraburkholderia sp. BL23I1N1]RKE25188.1 hypothetical protein B0G76_6707 [Paraburkholderia sp. BL23I1N1]
MEIHDDVPASFPRDMMPPVVSGAQPKLYAVLVDGIYVTGQTDTARYERWLICEYIANQFVPIVRKEGAAHPQHSNDRTLDHVCRAVAGKAWISPDELTWLAQRLRTLVGS